MKCLVSNHCSLQRCKITKSCVFNENVEIIGYSAPNFRPPEDVSNFYPLRRKIKEPARVRLANDYKRFDFKSKETECYYCDGSIGRGNKTKDHVYPRSKGGTLPDNFVWACNKCNHHKGDKTLEEWRDYLLNDVIMSKAKGHLRGHKNKILKKLNFMIEKLNTI